MSRTPSSSPYNSVGQQELLFILVVQFSQLQAAYFIQLVRHSPFLVNTCTLSPSTRFQVSLSLLSDFSCHTLIVPPCSSLPRLSSSPVYRCFSFLLFPTVVLSFAVLKSWPCPILTPFFFFFTLLSTSFYVFFTSPSRYNFFKMHYLTTISPMNYRHWPLPDPGSLLRLFPDT